MFWNNLTSKVFVTAYRSTIPPNLHVLVRFSKTKTFLAETF